MKQGERSAWIGSTLVAVALHSSAIVAFASLLQERTIRPGPTVNFESKDWLETVAVEETVVPEVASEISQSTEVALVPPGQTPVVESVVESPAPEGQSSEAVMENAAEPPAVQSETSNSVAETNPRDYTTAPEIPSADVPPIAASEALVTEVVPDSAVSVAQPSDSIQEQTGDSSAAQADAAPDTAAEILTDGGATQESPSVEVIDSAEGSNVGQLDEVATSETDSAAEVLSEAPASAQSDAVGEAAAEPEEQIALLEPKPQQLDPPPEPPQAPAPPVDVRGAISSYRGGTCFMALPEQVADGSWRVTSYGQGTGDFDAFDTFLESKNIRDIRKDQRGIQNTQCGAVSLAQTFAPTPNEKLAISIESATVADGSILHARITGMERKWVYVLLIDDDGLAHDVSRYANLAAGMIDISMPVYVKNDGRDRTQLLMAINSDKSLGLLDLKTPELLANMLPLVKGEIVASEAKVSVAISHFQVK